MCIYIIAHEGNCSNGNEEQFCQKLEKSCFLLYSRRKLHRIVKCVISHSVEKISQQNFAAWFFLATYSKLCKERDSYRQELLSKVKSEIGDLEQSQSIRSQKKTLHYEIHDRKSALEKKPKMWLDNPLLISQKDLKKSQSIYSCERLFEEIKHMTHRSSHPFKQKPKNLDEIKQRKFLSHGVNPREMHGRLTYVWRIVNSRNSANLEIILHFIGTLNEIRR